MVQGEAERGLGLLLYITQLRPYDHFVDQAARLLLRAGSPSSVKFQRTEPFLLSIFDECSAANVRSIARYFRVRRR